MVRVVLIIALGLWTTAAIAAGKLQPLKVKTGFWESTMNQKASGSLPVAPDMQARLAQMTPQQRAMFEAYLKGLSVAVTTPKTIISKGCWTEKDLNHDPLFEDRCTWSELTSTGTKLEGKGTCWMDKARQEKINATMHIEVLDPEHVTGTVRLVMSSGGPPMTSDYKLVAKYLGPVCGKNESHMEMQTKP